MIRFVASWVSFQRFSIPLESNTLEPSVEVKESSDCVENLETIPFLGRDSKHTKL